MFCFANNTHAEAKKTTDYFDAGIARAPQTSFHSKQARYRITGKCAHFTTYVNVIKNLHDPVAPSLKRFSCGAYTIAEMKSTFCKHISKHMIPAGPGCNACSGCLSKRDLAALQMESCKIPSETWLLGQTHAGRRRNKMR
jgi:hypothetical protein